ncbi:MAG: twin-arginine translocation signal domain-containing protein [Boseongicola sp.]|nr:twin-arginine translocation signal domain-containing protein [Boseongicola sp.]
MSTEINRRDFLKLVSATASAAALAGEVALWPTEAMSRPLAEPAVLALDESRYIIDPSFDFCPDLPTYRAWLSLENMTPTQIKSALKDEEWRFEHLVDDPDNWSVCEIDHWLDQTIELDDLSPRASMEYSQYAPGIRIHDHLGWEAADDLGLAYIEGEMPGHHFVGVRLDGDIDDLNAGLARHGLNLIVQEG